MLSKCACCSGLWDDKGKIYCRYDQDMETCKGPEENKDEITLNQDDPRWKQRVAGLTDAIYDQMKEEAREAKKRKKRRAPLTNMTITVNGKTPIEEYAESRKEAAQGL